jgi:hypothetical protein
MFYSYTDDPGNFIAVPIERVKHIIELNKAGEKPDALLSLKDQVIEVKQPDYENVVGQDSLTRFDQAKRSKKNKKRPGAPNRPMNSGQKTTAISEGAPSDQPRLVQHNRSSGNNAGSNNPNKSGNQSNWRNKSNRSNQDRKQNPPSEPKP